MHGSSTVFVDGCEELRQLFDGGFSVVQQQSKNFFRAFVCLRGHAMPFVAGSRRIDRVLTVRNESAWIRYAGQPAVFEL